MRLTHRTDILCYIYIAIFVRGKEVSLLDESKRQTLEKRIHRTMDALEKNHIRTYYMLTKEDAVKQVEALLQEGNVISCGSSVTLSESGTLALVKNGHYRFIDRDSGEFTREEADRRGHNADVFLMSSNAITENGELYNVDGNSNRVSALAHGPKKVIVVAGYNKIVSDLPAAIKRIKEIAAPANGIRLGTNTPCAKIGHCCNCNGHMTSGCATTDRMCINYLVTAYQRTERIHVIIVGEELGY